MQGNFMERMLYLHKSEDVMKQLRRRALRTVSCFLTVGEGGVEKFEMFRKDIRVHVLH